MRKDYTLFFLSPFFEHRRFRLIYHSSTGRALHPVTGQCQCASLRRLTRAFSIHFCWDRTSRISRSFSRKPSLNMIYLSPLDLWCQSMMGSRFQSSCLTGSSDVADDVTVAPYRDDGFIQSKTRSNDRRYTTVRCNSHNSLVVKVSDHWLRVDPDSVVLDVHHVPDLVWRQSWRSPDTDARYTLPICPITRLSPYPWRCESDSSCLEDEMF